MGYLLIQLGFEIINKKFTTSEFFSLQNLESVVYLIHKLNGDNLPFKIFDNRIRESLEFWGDERNWYRSGL